MVAMRTDLDGRMIFMELTEVEKLHIRQANKFVERIQPQWSAITQKFFMYCIAKVDTQKEHFEPMEILMSELPKILGYSEGITLAGTEVKTIFSELNSNSSVQIIQDLGKGKKSYHSIFLFQEIYFNEKENKVRILFSEPMIDQILQLTNKRIGFTDFKYAEIINIQGSYSTRLIELLHQYKKIGKRIFTLEELRTILDIPTNRYEDYRDFKKRILDQAKKEINNNPKSTINIDYTSIKVGRSIGKIEFIITARKLLTTVEQAIEEQLALFSEEVAATVSEESINDPQLKEIYKRIVK